MYTGAAKPQHDPCHLARSCQLRPGWESGARSEVSVRRILLAVLALFVTMRAILEPTKVAIRRHRNSIRAVREGKPHREALACRNSREIRDTCPPRRGSGKRGTALARINSNRLGRAAPNAP